MSQLTPINNYYVCGNWAVIPASSWISDEIMKSQMRTVVGEIFETFNGSECIFLDNNGTDGIYIFKFHMNLSMIRVIYSNTPEVSDKIAFVENVVRDNFVPALPTKKMSDHIYLQIFAYIPCNFSGMTLKTYENRGVVDEDLFGNKLSVGHYEYYQMMSPFFGREETRNPE